MELLVFADKMHRNDAVLVNRAKAQNIRLGKSHRQAPQIQITARRHNALITCIIGRASQNPVRLRSKSGQKAWYNLGKAEDSASARLASVLGDNPYP